MKMLAARDFSLKHTIESGQIFRWKLLNGWYLVSVGSSILKIRQKGNTIFYTCNGSLNVNKFFSLDENYHSILKQIRKDKFMKKAIDSCCGLRLIRQEPWECTISFIASSYSNIPKIRKSISSLCMRFGEKISLGKYSDYSFPNPGNLNNIKKLESCSLGYRADYIRRAAGKIASKKDFLKRIKNLSYEDAKKELIKLPGVGDKVADCILLFSLGHHEAFPVDVWIKRIMEQNYFGGKAMPNKKIVAFARDYFGEYAGYAQQFLYHYARNLNEK